MIHDTPSPFAGTEIVLREESTHPHFENFAGAKVTIVDWWDRIKENSWQLCYGEACVIYGVRLEDNDLPIDNEVLIGEYNGNLCLIHTSEIDEENTELSQKTFDIYKSALNFVTTCSPAVLHTIGLGLAIGISEGLFTQEEDDLATYLKKRIDAILSEEGLDNYIVKKEDIPSIYDHNLEEDDDDDQAWEDMTDKAYEAYDEDEEDVSIVESDSNESDNA